LAEQFPWWRLCTLRPLGVLVCLVMLSCAASYGPVPLEPERPIAELSEDEWQVLCRWVNSRRPSFPSGDQVCLEYDPDDFFGPSVTSFRFGEGVDFCELRGRVEAETVGELAEVVECQSRWRERRVDFFRGVPSGCGCGEPPRDPDEDPMVLFCPMLPCDVVPTVFALGWGKCYDGPDACPFECGCTCGAGPRECRD
jgi:hypothetical protein